MMTSVVPLCDPWMTQGGPGYLFFSGKKTALAHLRNKPKTHTSTILNPNMKPKKPKQKPRIGQGKADTIEDNIFSYFVKTESMSDMNLLRQIDLDPSDLTDISRSNHQ